MVKSHMLRTRISRELLDKLKNLATQEGYGSLSECVRSVIDNKYEEAVKNGRT